MLLFIILRLRLGNDTFYNILHYLISQAITLKLISGEITPVDSTHLWAYSNGVLAKKSATANLKNVIIMLFILIKMLPGVENLKIILSSATKFI